MIFEGYRKIEVLNPILRIKGAYADQKGIEILDKFKSNLNPAKSLEVAMLNLGFSKNHFKSTYFHKKTVNFYKKLEDNI